MPDNEQIRRRAYEIWEREGRPEGREAEHWRRAAEELAASEAVKTQDVPAARVRDPAKLEESRGTAPAAPSPEQKGDPLGVAQPVSKAARKRNGSARGGKARMRPDAAPPADPKAPDRTR